MVIIARLLDLDTFGQFGMIQSTVGMLGIFAGLGLGLPSTKYVAEFRTQDPARAGRIIALGSTVAILSGGLLTLVLLAFAPLFASKLLNAPELTGELRIASRPDSSIGTETYAKDRAAQVSSSSRSSTS